MRAFFALTTVALTLAACGRQEAAEPAKTAAAPAAPTGPTAAPSATPPVSGQPGSLGAGSSLSASVSGLSGAVLPFQVQETDTAVIVELAADVLFAFDSDRLSPEAPAQLRKTADLIAKGGKGVVAVIGHTDAKGADAYNDDLSLRRARSVVAWLGADGGVPAGRLKAEGRGEREPVAPNATASGADDPDGRARNRRVTVVIPKA